MITLTYSVIATYFLGQVTKISGFSGIGGINRYTPGWIGDIARPPEPALLHRARRRARRLRPDPLHRPDAVRARRSRASATSRCGWLARLQRAAPPDARVRLRRVRRRPSPACSTSGGTDRSRPATSTSPQTINLLIMAVIGGLGRIEGAWIGAFAFIVMQQLHHATRTSRCRLGGTLFGGSFNTIIGIIFLAIVLVSPGGLMGIWDRLFELGADGRTRRGTRRAGGRAARNERHHDVRHLKVGRDCVRIVHTSEHQRRRAPPMRRLTAAELEEAAAARSFAGRGRRSAATGSLAASSARRSRSRS